jgi:hypothetical protein
VLLELRAFPEHLLAKAMSDFERALVNSLKANLPWAEVSLVLVYFGWVVMLGIQNGAYDCYLLGERLLLPLEERSQTKFNLKCSNEGFSCILPVLYGGI